MSVTENSLHARHLPKYQAPGEVGWFNPTFWDVTLLQYARMIVRGRFSAWLCVPDKPGSSAWQYADRHCAFRRVVDRHYPGGIFFPRSTAYHHRVGAPPWNVCLFFFDGH